MMNWVVPMNCVLVHLLKRVANVGAFIMVGVSIVTSLWFIDVARPMLLMSLIMLFSSWFMDNLIDNAAVCQGGR